MANWELIENDLGGHLDMFALGKASARETRKRLRGEAFTEFDRVLRERGVDEARVLARKALRRRGYLV